MKHPFQYIQYGPAFQSAQVDERVIPLSPSCAGLDGRTLLFMSDIHLSERFPESALERLIAQAASLNPDVLLLGGDYAESVEYQYRFFEMISALRPPLGAYAVLGNNDLERFPDSLTPLLRAMRQAGVTPLQHQIARISTSDGRISIAGLEEFRRADLDRQALFSKRDLNAFRILLAHFPQSVVWYMNRSSILPDLCLAGHTHGGQFRLGPLTPYSICFERNLRGIPLPAVSGWSPMGESTLLVSPGIGTSRLPFRMGVPPAIHLIRLQK